MDDPNGVQIDKLAGLHKWLRPLLIAGLVTTAIVMVHELVEGLGIWNLETAADVDMIAILLVTVTSLLFIVVLFATLIIFGMWIYRAAANVQAAEVDGFEYTPGWSVGWLFVPFANLFKPFQAMRQIYNASFGARGMLDQNHQVLTIWWATWIISNILSNISLRVEMSATSPDSLSTAMLLGAAGSAVSLVLYPAAMRLVREVTEGQQEHLILTDLEQRFS